MPKIPTYTAQGTQVRPQSPDYIGAGQVPDIATPAIRGVQEIAREVGYQATLQERAAAKLQKLQDDLDTTTLSARYGAGLKAIQEELIGNQNYPAHEKVFLLGAKKLEDELTKDARNPDVLYNFKQHIANVLPYQQINVRSNANKLWLAQYKTNVESVGNALAEEAIRAPLTYDSERGFTSTVRNVNIATYKRLLEEGRQLGALTAEEEAKMFKDHNGKILKDSMERLRLEGRRDELFALNMQGAWNDLSIIERNKILSQTNQDAREEDTRNEKVVNKTKQAMYLDALSQALDGKLPQSVLESIKTGKHSWIDTDKYEHLQRVNENPPSSEGNLQANIIMDEYAGQSITAWRIAIPKARAALVQLQQSLDRPNKSIRDDLLKLQTDERSMTSMVNVNLNQNLKWFDDNFDSLAPPRSPLAIINRMQDDILKRYKNEGERRIRDGEEPRAVAKDIGERIDKEFKRTQKQEDKKIDPEAPRRTRPQDLLPPRR